uniref:Uncharacterized protein n=1 Tax=Mizugakiibacter sediminis TaxID=1475481 RepID=A0A0S6YW30_9GAMM
MTGRQRQRVQQRALGAFGVAAGEQGAAEVDVRLERVRRQRDRRLERAARFRRPFQAQQRRAVQARGFGGGGELHARDARGVLGIGGAPLFEQGDDAVQAGGEVHAPRGGGGGGPTLAQAARARQRGHSARW